jgi:hypothetical protein
MQGREVEEAVEARGDQERAQERMQICCRCWRLVVAACPNLTLKRTHVVRQWTKMRERRRSCAKRCCPPPHPWGLRQGETQGDKQLPTVRAHLLLGFRVPRMAMSEMV